MRYPLEAGVSFRWKDKDGKQQKGEGTSRDLSETGTFVFTPACPPVGSEVELRISFATLPRAASDMRMELEGRVLRVEKTSSGKVSGGFAVATNEATLRESDESAGEESAGANQAT
jgi:PilZ domain